MNIEWPHTTEQMKRPCVVCGKKVFQVQSPYNKDKWSPESKHWNMEHQEIYCGVYCSFQKHEERRCLTS